MAWDATLIFGQAAEAIEEGTTYPVRIMVIQSAADEYLFRFYAEGQDDYESMILEMEAPV
jgi:hypothetical protein